MSDIKTTPESVQTNIILETLSEGVCQISANGYVSYANESALRMLEVGVPSKKDLYYSELFFGKTEAEYNAENPFCPIQFSLNSGENSHVGSESFVKMEGGTFTVEYVCVPLFEEEEIVGAVISFQDISERFEAEKELARTRDLALAAAETKAAFLANMSHEIRTPLNGIVGTTNLLLDSELGRDHREYVEMLKKSTDLLRGIVNDILDFSKLEAGAFSLERVEFSLFELAEDTAKFFSAAAAAKELELELDLEEGIPDFLIGDVGKVRQILNNFVSNALKFTSTGKIRVKISSEYKAADSVGLKFEVEDSGIGIKEETRELLFQPFSQADQSTTRVYGGTGLGLAICREMVEMMDGEIGFESEFGRGSNFWFSASFGRSPENDRYSGSKQARAIETEVVSAGHKAFSPDLRILVVEDNPINRVVTLKMLEQIGLESESAENGVEALKLLENREFDLVFMDCQMPELDGFETTRKIRELGLEGPKIIALTAGTSRAERDMCVESGMDDFLPKPFSKNDLSEMLDKYFEPEFGEARDEPSSTNSGHPLAGVIDDKKLENFLEIESNGRDQFIGGIFALFIDHSGKLISELNIMVESGKLPEIKQIAHNLKGSSANVGLKKLEGAFEKLEEIAETSGTDEIRELLEQINSEFKKIEKTIVLLND